MDARISADEGSINVSKFPTGSEQLFKLDKSSPWVMDLLIELNENADLRTPEQWAQSGVFDLDFSITKKNDQEKGFVLYCKGKVYSEYMTKCVNTLKLMKEILDFDFACAFMDENIAKETEYIDNDEIYDANQTFDLYFFSKNKVNFKEMIHEQIYLNFNEYPTLEKKLPDSNGNNSLH